MSTIAIFHPSADLYGSDRILVNVLGAMPEDTLKVVYLLSHGPLVNFLTEKVKNIEIIICPNIPVIYRKIFTLKGILIFLISWFKFIFFLKKQKNKYAFKSAYVNTLSNSFLLPILTLLNIKRFIHVHEIIVSPRIIGKITAFLATRFSQKIICVSAAVAKNLKSYTKNKNQNIIVIHNGIDAIKTCPRNEDNTLSFYLFGRIMPQKGQWLVVEALSKIPLEKLKNTKFTFMGGALYNQESVIEDLKAKIETYGLTKFIDFKPFAANISEAMSQADICLIPSTILDSFPTTVLEAMSAEKLVIATDQGGAKEAIKDQQTGLLFEHKNANSLADRIKLIIDTPQLLNEMSFLAKTRFDRNFTLRFFKEKWHRMMSENQYA